MYIKRIAILIILSLFSFQFPLISFADNQENNFKIREQRLEEEIQALSKQHGHTSKSLVALQAESNVIAADLVIAQDNLSRSKDDLNRVVEHKAEVSFRKDNVEDQKNTAQVEGDRAKERIEDGKSTIANIVTGMYISAPVDTKILNILSLDGGDMQGKLLYDKFFESNQEKLSTHLYDLALTANLENRLSAIDLLLTDLRDTLIEEERREVQLVRELEEINSNIESLDATNKDNQDRAAAELISLAGELEEHRAAKDQVSSELFAYQQEQIRVAEEQRKLDAQNNVSRGNDTNFVRGAGMFANPLQHTSVSSPFGYRDIFKAGELHTGVDFAVPCGTPVRAARNGTVIETSSIAVGYGNRVVVDHGVIDGVAYSTTYNHLSGFDTSKGAQVSEGQIIARSGTTGNSTGCHLHFEVSRSGQYVDPLPYL